MSKKKKYSPFEQKLIIEAHNRSENGIKLGIKRSEKTGNSESPLFNINTQINLF